MPQKSSSFFTPTLRQDPAEAETVSHKLLLRAGYIRQLAAGIYSLLPLAQRSRLKIMSIIREEMTAIGAQEFHLPALHPGELWRESGRYEVMGDNMFKLRDRSARDMVLGMTHEEVFTAIARDEIRSYRELPQIWYQIQTKFRDEARAKSGLLRVREFTMKDSYSFDVDRDGLDKAYERHAGAYRKIFSRCGLEFLCVEAFSGAMGGSDSQEFMVRSRAGEDDVACCTSCDHAANLEKAASRLEPLADPESPAGSPAQVATPGQKTIADIEAFLGWPAIRQIKTLVYMVDDAPVLALLRGNDALNESKLVAAMGATHVRPAAADEILDLMGASAGSLGPVGAPEAATLLADLALKGRRNLACGANQEGFHLTGVEPGRDFNPRWVDLRNVTSGEGCIRCGKPLRVDRCIEIGHIFKLGTRYSETLGATILDKNGKAVPLVMGSYGIGVERLLASAVELYADEKGIVLPPAIAPFGCILVPTKPGDPAQDQAVARLSAQLEMKGIDVLVDDRRERPGVKFKDSELIGIPSRITLGRGLAGGRVEVHDRRQGRTEDTELTVAAAAVEAILARRGGR
ncbi:MAG: proline--tRNA ligase [Acidobacteriota bacterium]